eukprot:GHVS01085906.1.p1 GENE.GHVS01085906.1~~GHVS01085906.1.p1  ORF type:complete len:307 (-),score=61.78 GHVS01085906.1:97-894(-)
MSDHSASNHKQRVSSTQHSAVGASKDDSTGSSSALDAMPGGNKAVSRIANMSGERIIRVSSSNNTSSGCNSQNNNNTLHDVTWIVEDLVDCELFLLGRLAAVYLHRLSNCLICIPSVTASALAYDLLKCDIVVTAQQLRLHDSESVNVYAQTASAPVIENCSKMRFGPFCVSSPSSLGSQPEKEASDKQPADVCRGGCCGDVVDVKDFSWLKHQKSPNWELITDKKERMSWSLKVKQSSEGTEGRWILDNELPEMWKRNTREEKL